MKTLEELLQELGCEGNAFDSTGEFTKAGEKAYDRLEHLLYDIERLTGKEVTPIIRGNLTKYATRTIKIQEYGH